MECAGGLAHDGENDILDIMPENIHQRTGIIMGSKHDVEECRQYHKKHSEAKKTELEANKSQSQNVKPSN